MDSAAVVGDPEVPSPLILQPVLEAPAAMVAMESSLFDTRTPRVLRHR